MSPITTTSQHPSLKTLLTALSISVLLTACASAPEPISPPAIEDATAEVVKPEPKPEEVAVPTRPFPGDSFHDLLVAEFAIRRNRLDLALGNYLQQAHNTRDAAVAKRATQLAQHLRADKATMDASQLWVELEPNSNEAHYTTAMVLAKKRRPVEAIEHMVQVLNGNGNTNFTAIAASSLQHPLDVRQQVEQIIDDLLLQHPSHIQLLTAKSLMLQQRGELDVALTAIRNVLAIDAKNLHAVVVEARLLQQLNRSEEAFSRLEQVLEQYPDNTRLRLQYARMLMNKDIGLAQKQFEILLSAAPNDADLLLSLGLISKESKDTETAENYFQRLKMTGKRQNEAHFYLGQLAEQQNQYDRALELYKQLVPGTDFLAATNRITNIYQSQGRLETAREHINDLRQRYPEHETRLYLLESELLHRNRRFEDAHSLLSDAILQAPQQVNLLYARSMLSEKMGNLALMEQDLLSILEQDPENATALNALGYVLANRTDRLDEAHQLISRALAAKPNDPAILDSLGWVEFRRGNLDKALTLLTQAYEQFPDPEVAAHLGEVLWLLGNNQQALTVWKEALKATPENPIILETMKRLAPSAI